MTRRNKKKKGKDGFIFPVPFTGAVVVLSALALGYVWLGCRCESLGRELKALEIEKAVLSREYLNEQYNWARMKAPGNIEKALAKHNIIMTWPRGDQVIWLYDTGILHDQVAEAGLRRAQIEDVMKLARLERVIMNE